MNVLVLAVQQKITYINSLWTQLIKKMLLHGELTGISLLYNKGPIETETETKSEDNVSFIVNFCLIRIKLQFRFSFKTSYNTSIYTFFQPLHTSRM